MSPQDLRSQARRQREYDKLHARILNTARTLFVQHGRDAVTMRAIAKKIGYSATTIYLHFKDKESLIRELCTADFMTLAQAFQKIARVTDPIERLRRVGEAYTEFGLRYPNHYRLMFMTPHPDVEPHVKDVEKGNPEQDAYAFLRYCVTEAIRNKRLRPELTDPDLLTQTIWAGGHGVISLEIAKAHDRWVDWCPIKKRVAAMIDALINGLIKR